MDIWKGLLRPTLVASIMAAIITLLSHEMFLPRNSVKVDITEMWRNKSFQHKLKGVDDLLEKLPRIS